MAPAQQASLDRFLVKSVSGATEQDGEANCEKVSTEDDQETQQLVEVLNGRDGLEKVQAPALAPAGRKGTLRSVVCLAHKSPTDARGQHLFPMPSWVVGAGAS